MNRIQKGGALAAMACCVVGGFEGVRYHAYPDPATRAAPYTICDGHTGPDVHPWSVYSPAKCKEILLKDLSREASAIEACVPSLKDAPPARYVAVLDFSHNLGAGAVCRHGRPGHESIGDLLNASDVAAACDKLLEYRFAAGRVMPGLERRREIERKMCLGEAQ